MCFHWRFLPLSDNYFTISFYSIFVFIQAIEIETQRMVVALSVIIQGVILPFFTVTPCPTSNTNEVVFYVILWYYRLVLLKIEPNPILLLSLHTYTLLQPIESIPFLKLIQYTLIYIFKLRLMYFSSL